MNTERFLSNLTILFGAGVSLLVIRTREPKKALLALEDFAIFKNNKIQKSKNSGETPLERPVAFGSWSVIDGWTVKEATDLIQDMDLPLAKDAKNSVKPDNNIDPGRALKALLGQPGQQDVQMGFMTKFPDGIYVMNWIHPMLENPLIKSCLLEAATKFPETEKRLALILPETVDVPSELTDMVCHLDFDVPSDPERVVLINEVFDTYQHRHNDPAGLSSISSAGAGMTGFEFESSLSRAMMTLVRQEKPITTEAIAAMVSINKTDMIKRSDVLEMMPVGDMSQVGGLENLKDWVNKRKDCFSKEARDFGVDAPKGLAMFGPPGTGKSLAAKAIGHALNLQVVKFDVSKVFGSLVGQSEGRVRTALKQIEGISPCVAFIDEIDKAFDRGTGGGDGGVGQRVLGSILTFMQESMSPVFWVMTGNRTQGLPAELLRKGRLDEVFSLTLPTPEEREDILQIHLRKRGKDHLDSLPLSVSASVGYVSAELEAAVKEAIVESYSRNIPLDDMLIAEQFSYMKPLSQAFRPQILEMQEWAEANARPASKPGTVEDIFGVCEKPEAPAKGTGRGRRVISGI